MTPVINYKLMGGVLILGTLVSNFIYIIRLHGYVLSAEQTKIDNDAVGGGKWNRTTTTSIAPHFRAQDDSGYLFDLENIPFFMKDYFEWHGRQLQQMREEEETAKKNGSDKEGDDGYLSQYRFLVLRCAASKDKDGNKIIEDRCGGLSDRLKPFPLFLWYAATTKRILFIRWGENRPAPIETFLVPGKAWNWTFPGNLLRKIKKLEDVVSIQNDDDKNFTRLYFDGSDIQHKHMLQKIKDQAVWMVEGNDFTGGRTRYKTFVEKSSSSISNHPFSYSDALSVSKLRPRDALYENFYHDLFHATFRPSLGVEEMLSSYFHVPEDEFSSTLRSWLPVPLLRNQYVVAHYRAKYPKEPYRETQNRTVLRETTVHAVECAKSRIRNSKIMDISQNMSSKVSAVYVASDTALVMEAVRDTYRNDNTSPSGKDTNSSNSMNIWTYLDLQSYDLDHGNGDRNGGTTITKNTVTLAEDPPHLNFAKLDDLSDFYVIFVDLFLMSYANCVVYGAGGFGRMGSLVSYRPMCGTPYTVNNGKLQQCNPYD